VSPDGAHTLRAALTAAKVNRPSVLWLDDLERYLGVGGLTLTDLADLNTVVLATMRTRERERLSHRHDATRDQLDRGLARAARELLDAVTTELHLDRMWSGRELAAAAHTSDPRIARAVITADRHGIAEQLAAGPDLARELRDGWDTHPEALPWSPPRSTSAGPAATAPRPWTHCVRSTSHTFDPEPARRAGKRPWTGSCGHCTGRAASSNPSMTATWPSTT
jgi:hypothetical protein